MNEQTINAEPGGAFLSPDLLGVYERRLAYAEGVVKWWRDEHCKYDDVISERGYCNALDILGIVNRKLQLIKHPGAIACSSPNGQAHPTAAGSDGGAQPKESNGK